MHVVEASSVDNAVWSIVFIRSVELMVFMGGEAGPGLAGTCCSEGATWRQVSLASQPYFSESREQYSGR